MAAIAWIILLLFLPACLGLLRYVIADPELSHQLLALALLLLCFDQARMAIVDLEQIAEVKQQIQDPRLDHFSKVTLSTIFIELLGFYSASAWLGWGVAIVLLSQVWFNLLAGIQLQPTATVVIQSCGISERRLVLLGNAISLLFLGLWMLQIAALWMAAGLLGMVIAYGCAKYILGPK